MVSREQIAKIDERPAVAARIARNCVVSPQVVESVLAVLQDDEALTRVICECAGSVGVSPYEVARAIRRLSGEEV